MDSQKKQERNFELRSEKTRSLVGEIPSALIRYGIIVIAITLLLLVGIATQFPYRKVYRGEATIYALRRDINTDSTRVAVKLRFAGEMPVKMTVRNKIILTSQGLETAGRLIDLKAHRDTLGRQDAMLLLAANPALTEYSMLSFNLTIEQGSILYQLLGIEN